MSVTVAMSRFATRPAPTAADDGSRRKSSISGEATWKIPESSELMQFAIVRVPFEMFEVYVHEMSVL